VRFVALGDSYTIGTSVSAPERWPDQLVARLADEAAGAGVPEPLELVGNPAVNGYTTRDVIARELPLLASWRPDICSILIGTNDVIQGIGDDEYRRNLDRILDAIEATAGAGRAFGVTSPDYTVTPAGADYGDPLRRGAQLRARNELFTTVLARRGMAVADILAISLRGATDRSLVAADGLHPSGRQYALWLDRIVPVVVPLLRDQS
jgi:lysophospholipase L1-like esterase